MIKMRKTVISSVIYLAVLSMLASCGTTRVEQSETTAGSSLADQSQTTLQITEVIPEETAPAVEEVAYLQVVNQKKSSFII